MSVCLSVYLSACLSVWLAGWLAGCLWCVVCPAVCQSVLLPNNFQIIEDLYLASDDEMKDIIFSYKKESQNIICIAHNPGIHQLALSLVKKSSIDPKFEKINHKYPTAALAVIKIKDGNWENLYSNQNELIDFITPKDLKH